MKRDSAHELGLKLGTARCDRYTHSASNASDDHITIDGPCQIGTGYVKPSSFTFLVCHSCRSHVLLASSRTINLDRKSVAIATVRRGESANMWSQSCPFTPAPSGWKHAIGGAKTPLLRLPEPDYETRNTCRRRRLSRRASRNL